MNINPSIKWLFSSVLFLLFVFSGAVSGEEISTAGPVSAVETNPIYSAGPWRGRVIEAGTWKPIEGAVVSAIWYRSFSARFTSVSDFHDAREVLTDKDGYFEIPVYTETGENKESWRKPQMPGPQGPIELAIIGPDISEPDFIIFKPGFDYYPGSMEIMVYAAGPAALTYREYYIGRINDEDLQLSRQSTKDFPEGLVYTGKRCFTVITGLFRKTNYRFDSVFIKMQGAGEKLESLSIPFDCPKGAEPVPNEVSGDRKSFDNPLKRGGYVIIALSKTEAGKDRMKAVPALPANADPDKLPLLSRLIREEKEKIELQKTLEQGEPAKQ